MVTRQQIVDCARSWKGTPFRHQAQLKGVGCDCKGLIVGIAAELELPEARTLAARVRNYSKAFRGRDMFDGLSVSLIRVPAGNPGDVAAILMARDPYPRHLGILTEDLWLIHTYGGGVGRVAEVPLGTWRIHSFWTWPSLGEQGG